MKTKLFTLGMIVSLVLGFSFSIATSVKAQTTSPFPVGCSSAIGYSVANGKPCNGTNVATTSLLPGCTTPLGYSKTTGIPCSGSSKVVFIVDGCTTGLGYSSKTGLSCNGNYPATVGPLPGCASAIGYSAMNGMPCNGTSFALFLPAGCLAINYYSTITGKICEWEMR